MDERTYSLREIAPLLARTREDTSAPQINRQVRHWTVHNLLTPEKKHTGRGRDRTYTFHQVRKAAVYVELARYGMTVGLLESVGDWLDMLAEDEAPAWTMAIGRSIRTYLQIVWTPEETLSCSISIHPDDMVKAKKAQGGKRATLIPAGVGYLDRRGVMGAHSMVVIALTSLFKSIHV